MRRPSPTLALVHQSALVIVIPEAEARVGAMRRKYDPQASFGVPAHITVLFPFMPPELVDPDVRRRLKRLFKRCSPFACHLARVERFPSTAYLAPAAAAPFIELTRAVVSEFPQYPPYGCAHAGIIPHLTVAHGDRHALRTPRNRSFGQNSNSAGRSTRIAVL